ncbi:MAG: hypothetical protein A3F16_01160 [Deltaproteobacteria bacterium RIFCSPHIGHO2_12_FULL_43_9]|nr:MAG: hypothetical protein A3F16_01160 [Deltaproteobacteria bacterium RIFCSPHIGHO2_12_FULL_43_9]
MKRANLKYILLLIPVILVVTVILSTKVRVENQSSEAAEKLWSEKTTIEPGLHTATLQTVQQEFIQLASTLNPAVVNISTETEIKIPRRMQRPPKGAPNGGPTPQNPNEEFFWKFFEDFFGGPYPFPPDQKQQSLGSGFVIHEDGYIITNNHVIEKADQIWVTFTEEENGKKYKAKTIGIDPKTDIALIKIDADRKLPVAPIGDSSSVQVGSLVLAIGNPFGHGHTVTMGIISATGRQLPSAIFSPYTDYFQTDASINPGNSGGPLINIKGEVIGIATAIDVRAQGIGFAIPVNIAKELIPHLKEKGKVIRGWLGVGIDKVTPEMQEKLKLPKDVKGVIVTEVFEGDPAAKAGVKPYDIIYEFDGKPITSQRDLITAVGASQVGTSATLKIYRDGKSKSFKVKLTERKDEEVAKESSAPQEKESFNLGMETSNITPQLVQGFNLTVKQGVVVTNVDPSSPTAEAGLRPGDVILEVDRKKINNTKELDTYLKSIKAGGLALLYVQRGDNKAFITLKIPIENKE